MMLSIFQIAFTGSIIFIGFYTIVSAVNLTGIFFKSAGLLFVNDMPLHLGMFMKQFVLDGSPGDIKWHMYTMERP